MVPLASRLLLDAVMAESPHRLHQVDGCMPLPAGSIAMVMMRPQAVHCRRELK